MTEITLTAEERNSLLVEGVEGYAMILLEAEGRVLSWNAGAERILGWTEAEVLGQSADLIFTPEDRAAGVPDQEMNRARAQGRALDLRWHMRKDGSRFFADGILERLRDEAGRERGFAKMLRDATEQGERRGRERFLADLAERARAFTDPDAVIADAVNSVGQFLGVSRCLFADIDIQADTCTIPVDYCADDTVASIRGVVPISAFGAFVVSEYAARRAVAVDDVRLDPMRAPEGSLDAYEAIGIRAHVTVPVVHSDRVVSCISVHNATPRQWKQEEVELLRAVVERTWLTVEVTRQERALRREAEARARILASITDAFFALDRDYRFTHVNGESERILFKTRDEMLGRYIWDVFPGGEGSTFDLAYRRAVTEGVPVSFEEFYPPLGTWFEVRAYPSDGGVSVFYQNVNARKTAEEERERLLAEQRTRAEREALLNRIGQALRGSPDPEGVLEAAVRELGQALGADRCYYAAYDQDADTAIVVPDWHRGGLPSISGQYPMSDYAVNRDPLYKAGHTQVVTDASDDPALLELGVRSLVRVPLVSGASMTALSVAMADGQREWTEGEVSLVEAVATQTQSALEAVRVQRREHNIAEQLQSALQPPLPEGVSGLKMAKHYEAALEEAGVGGDFYDVFPLEKGRTALVVGDLSGKGLAAAAQVSVVRNMLRAFLYSKPTLADAATDLNRVVALNGLLSGFATLWVGCFDSPMGELRYVNLGQEPALLRRGATGQVEQLPPTGPVLGADGNARYEEVAVALSPGDALAVFSDGVTECGPSRREMLGIDGVAGLLGQTFAPEEAEIAGRMAEAVTRRLVAGVDEASRGGVPKDDVCILVAVAE